MLAEAIRPAALSGVLPVPYGLLAWYEHQISTGPLEGVNNKIKTIQGRACGFRDYEYFLWGIYGLHETEYALLG